MRKVLLLIMCFAVYTSSAQQGGASFSLDAPGSVVAGNEFEVTLIFKKGDLKDYSRFSQDLPLGFTASNVISPNADFTFSDQRIRIIWLKLPDEDQVEVKYAIDVHERLSGKLELSGTFAYVHESERAYISLPEPVIVNILPNPEIDEELVVDISEFHTIITPEPVTETTPQPGSSDYAMVLRQKPLTGQNGIVYVSLLLRNPEGSTFLKLEESIPGGYSFESIESGGAVVSHAASLARFVWMRPPVSPVLLVKYRLVPILEKDQEPLVLSGIYTYTEDGESVTATAREVDVDLASLNSRQQADFLKTGALPEGLAEMHSTGSVAYGKESAASVREAEKTVSSAGRGTEQTSLGSRRSSGPPMINIAPLDAVDGISFRVQVAAVKNPYFAGVLFAENELLRDVKVEKEGVWSKYTLGPLSTYDDAVRMKNRIINETSINSAFIVAYRNGVRIPVNTVR